MALKTIKKSIDINASREHVWKVLFSNDTYVVWAAAFSDGAIAKTDWQEGSKAIFTDNSNSGLVGNIVKSTAPSMLSIEYTGEVKDGVEEYESDAAKEFKGGMETYTLTEKDGGTHLDIASDMDETYFDMMAAAWDKALVNVKELAEK